MRVCYLLYYNYNSLAMDGIFKSFWVFHKFSYNFKALKWNLSINFKCSFVFLLYYDNYLYKKKDCLEKILEKNAF